MQPTQRFGISNGRGGIRRVGRIKAQHHHAMRGVEILVVVGAAGASAVQHMGDTLAQQLRPGRATRIKILCPFQHCNGMDQVNVYVKDWHSH